MSIKRRQRRADQKRRFKLLQGGAPGANTPTEPAPDGTPDTPPARFAHALDSFIRQRCLVETTLSSTEVLSVLLQMSAALAAELNAPAEDVIRALDVFIDRERTARRKT